MIQNPSYCKSLKHKLESGDSDTAFGMLLLLTPIYYKVVRFLIEVMYQTYIIMFNDWSHALKKELP